MFESKKKIFSLKQNISLHQRKCLRKCTTVQTTVKKLLGSTKKHIKDARNNNPESSCELDFGNYENCILSMLEVR